MRITFICRFHTGILDLRLDITLEVFDCVGGVDFGQLVLFSRKTSDLQYTVTQAVSQHNHELVAQDNYKGVQYVSKVAQVTSEEKELFEKYFPLKQKF